MRGRSRVALAAPNRSLLEPARLQFGTRLLAAQGRDASGSTCLGTDSSDGESRVAREDGVGFDIALHDRTSGDDSMFAIVESR